MADLTLGLEKDSRLSGHIVNRKICVDEFRRFCIHPDLKGCFFVAQNGMVTSCSLRRKGSCISPKKVVVLDE